MPDYEKEIEKVEAALADLKARQRAEREDQAARVTPEYRFTLLPVVDKYDQIADPSCRWYELRGIVLNRDELQAVDKRPFEGGMRYLFNSLSGRFAISSGGGSIFLNLTSYHGKEADTEAFRLLEQFILDHPEGGDVTEIVDLYRGNR